MLLPILVVIFGGAVAATRHDSRANSKKWYLDVDLYLRLHVPAVLALLLIGVGLAISNMSLIQANYPYVDPLIRTTITVVLAGGSFQWPWVVLVCLETLASGTIYYGVSEDDPQKAARITQRRLRVFSSSAQERALLIWRAKVLPQHGGPTILRTLLCYSLHIPVIILAMVLASGYVSRVA